jgi:alanine racemase
MSRPIRARLDWSALRHNHSVVRHHAGGAKVWSVVKADAYGHGLLPAAHALADATDGFALVEIEGALALRDAGLSQAVLMLEGPYQSDELALYAEFELTPVLHTMWQVDALVESRLPVRLPVYVKLNTGMNRLGFNADELPVALDKLVAADCAGDPDDPFRRCRRTIRNRAAVAALSRHCGQPPTAGIGGQFSDRAALSRSRRRLGSPRDHALRGVAVSLNEECGRTRLASGNDNGKRTDCGARAQVR